MMLISRCCVCVCLLSDNVFLLGSYETPSKSLHWLLLLRISCWSSSSTQTLNVGEFQHSAFSVHSQSLDESSISMTLWVLKRLMLKFLFPSSLEIQMSILLSTRLPHGWLKVIANSTCPQPTEGAFYNASQVMSPLCSLYWHPVSHRV